MRLFSWEEEPCQTLGLWAVLGLCSIVLLPRVAPWLRGRVAATALRGAECGAASTAYPP